MQQLETSPKLTLDIPSGAKFTVKKVGRTEGYDGHCLRAYSYFGKEMPDIDPNSVDSINSIKTKYPQKRQDSKIPTFLLTYGGTYKGIVEQTGLSEEEAQDIEKQYHLLYKHSDDWVKSKIDRARVDGYITVAFGLRVRTPILAQTINSRGSTPYEAQREARTAGNALGQSYGLLNNRAAIEFMSKVRKSPYKHDIKPCIHIHDAQYYLVRDNIDIIEYINTNLIKAMEWQEDPAIQHDKVKLKAKLDIFYPTWADPIEIPNSITGSEIRTNVIKALNDRRNT